MNNFWESNREAYFRIKREILTQEYSFIMEGIDMDKPTKTVSFKLPDGVNNDASILLKPTYSQTDGMDVISIFKRKRADIFSFEGNPLIYALRGLKGWTFKNTQTDIINLLNFFLHTSENIRPAYDTIITAQTENDINLQFLHPLNKLIRSDFKIYESIFNLYIEDVYENYIDWHQMGIDYGDEYDNIEEKMNEYFTQMEIENGNHFSFKFIKDANLMKYIKITKNQERENAIKYAPQINDKHILILDDTIGHKIPVSYTSKTISQTYVPKSITVITLLSKF